MGSFGRFVRRVGTKAREFVVVTRYDVHGTDEIGSTSLHYLVAQEHHTETVCDLASAGADVNARDGRGATPLHVASGYGITEMVQVLIYADANVNITDNNGATPLYWAARTIAKSRFLSGQTRDSLSGSEGAGLGS